jgi:hypothetical protein
MTDCSLCIVGFPHGADNGTFQEMEPMGVQRSHDPGTVGTRHRVTLMLAENDQSEREMHERISRTQREHDRPTRGG